MIDMLIDKLGRARRAPEASVAERAKETLGRCGTHAMSITGTGRACTTERHGGRGTDVKLRGGLLVWDGISARAGKGRLRA